MAFLKMMILSVLVSFAAWSEALRCGFCLLSKREISQDRALSFWLKLIGKVDLICKKIQPFEFCFQKVSFVL